MTSVSHLACSSDSCILSCICTCSPSFTSALITYNKDIAVDWGFMTKLTKMKNVLEISITIMTFTLLQLIRVNCGAEMVCPWRPSQPVLCCLCQCPLLCPPAAVNAHHYAHQAHQCPHATRLPGRRKFSQCVALLMFDMVWKCGAQVV